MTPGRLILGAVVATALQLSTVASAQGLGYTRMNLPFLLGTMVTPDRTRANALGFVMHMMVGICFALLYAAVFDALGRANWWLGGIGGVLHGFFVLLVGLPLLPTLHPRIATERQGPTPTRLLQPPGFMALHYGRGTPLFTILSHIVFGVVLGMFFRFP